MKLFLKNKISFVCIAAICISLSSCVDDSIDLNNISSNMSLGGTLAAPIGEITVTVKEIMDSLEYDDSDNFLVNERNGVVNIFYTDTFDYSPPSEIDFTDFGVFHKTLIPGTSTGFEIETPSTETTYTVDNLSYNFDDINENPSKQRIDSIRFTNTVIKAKISTNLPTGTTSIYLHLPIEFEGESSQVVQMDLNNGTTYGRFPAENFIVRSEGKQATTFPIDVTVKGGTTLTSAHYIDIEVYLDSMTYIAYGYFNNGTDLSLKKESMDLDLYSVLPDSSLIFPHNPEIQFDVTSDIGIPILFNIKSVKTYATKTSPHDSAAVTFDGLQTKTFTIHRAESVGSTTTTSFNFDKEVSNGNTADLFKIKVDSAGTNYSLGVKDSTYSTTEFIKSDCKIKVKVSVNVPFWLDEKSTISYTDTLWNVNRNLDDIFDNSEIEKAALRIKYTNMLPVGVITYVRLLDENSLVIPGSSLYTYSIDSAPVDADGVSIAPGTEQMFDIIFDDSNIKYLKETHHIKLTFKSKEEITNESKIKLSVTDWIKAKVSVYVIGEGSIN